MRKSEIVGLAVQDLENRLVPIEDNLDAAIRNFASSLPAVTEQWMSREIKSRIEVSAAQFNALGVDRARALKSRFAELRNTLPTLCSTSIRNERVWPHKASATPATIGSHSSRREVVFFEEAFREVINNLGALLDAHQLFANEKLMGGWKRVNSGQVQYVISIGFEVVEKMPEVEKYFKIRAEQKALRESLQAERLNLEKVRAEELWDDA